MNYMLYGGAGFIGTNLVKKLAGKCPQDDIRIIDKKKFYFDNICALGLEKVTCISDEEFPYLQFDRYLDGVETVYHLMSTSMPSTTNGKIANEINDNIAATINLLDACVHNQVKKVVFISSGGTVYGKHDNSPICEEEPNYPITAYGIQKLTIEKLLYLYYHLHNLDYRIIRLSNPYGEFQRPNGKLGVVTTFIYNALNDHQINVYGDGGVVRDYIYIDDATTAITNIENYCGEYRLFNVGSGIGYSVNNIISLIEEVLNVSLNVNYSKNRPVDVPVNILNVNRYESIFGKCACTDLKTGIYKTYDFLKEQYREG